MRKFAYSFFVIFAIFASVFAVALTLPASAAAEKSGTPPDIRAQLRISPAHKKVINSMFSGVIDDPYLVTAVPELKEVVDNSLVRFFAKTSFEAILKDVSMISFFYSANGGKKEAAGPGNERSAAAIFTFGGPETPERIYSTRKDLLEMFNYEKDSTREIKIVEDGRRSGYDFVYAEAGGNVLSPALMLSGRHIAALYCPKPSAEKFGELAARAAAFIMEHFSGEKDPQSVCGEIPAGFAKDCDVLVASSFANFAVEDTAAAALLEGAVIGAKLADDMSSLWIDSFLRFRDGAPGGGAAEKSGAAESVDAKTVRALKLLFRPLSSAHSAADYLFAGVAAFVEFNLNFNEDFLALTDIFVFRGILLTATGVDYKEDFLSWFDGNIFFALCGSDLDFAGAVKDKKAAEVPAACVGFRSKNAALAEKFGAKLAALIGEYVPQAKVEEFKIDGMAAHGVRIDASPYFKEFEAVFGAAGDYYLLASSKEVFKKQAAAAKMPKNALSAAPGFKAAAGSNEGRFFNFYIDYRPVRAALEKLVKTKPELELIAKLPLEFYLSGAAMAASGGIESRAVFSLDRERLALALSKFSAASLARYFDMLDRLMK